MNNLGLIGKKVGMTREFFASGISVPVTVIKVEKGRIIDLITKDTRGYNAVRVGFGPIKSSKLTKSMKGFFSKKSTEPKKILKEFRVDSLENFKEGNEIGLEILQDVKFVDIKSKTIGKGFAGVMKRHNFSGQRASHGVHKVHRAGGSIGNASYPGRVFKGQKMAGRMGNEKNTIQSVTVVGIDEDKNYLLVNGSVPGKKGNIVQVRPAVKLLNADEKNTTSTKIIERNNKEEVLEEE